MVAHQPTSFREGVVSRVEAASLHYRYGQPLQGKTQTRTDEVMLSRAWRLGAKVVPRVGAYAICQIDAKTWTACRIESVDHGVIRALDALATPHNIEQARLILPGSATRADISQLFAKQENARRFDTQFFKAMARAAKGSPCPKPGSVVAARYGEFHRARVKHAPPGCASVDVEWLDRAKGRRTVKRFDVIAIPNSLQQPTPGDFALDRRAEKKPWRVFRVSEVGEGYVDLRTRVGGRSKTTGQHLLVIGP